jgi:hypothetical protein
LSDEICAATFTEMIDVQESEAAAGNKKVVVVEENKSDDEQQEISEVPLNYDTLLEDVPEDETELNLINFRLRRIDFIAKFKFLQVPKEMLLI